MKEERRSKRHELAASLLASLEARQTPVGTRLPTIRRLSAEWNVMPLTVVRVLDELTESGYLRHEANRGYYLAKAFPPRPRIGYLGSLPSPEDHIREWIREEALHSLFDELGKEGLAPELFSYADFVKSGPLPPRLSELNGLLVEGFFYDETVARKLQDFKGAVVVLGESPQTETNPVSHLRTDYRRALNEFFKMRPLSGWRRHVIVRAGHFNAARLSDLIQEYLAQAGLKPAEEIVLEVFSDAELIAMEWFRQSTRDWKDTLLFSLSGYFSRGLLAALREKGELPDILSFDNLEARMPLRGEKEAYFTSIDRNMQLVYRRGVHLLRDLIVRQADEVQVIGLHASLVIRKSVHGLLPEGQTKSLK